MIDPSRQAGPARGGSESSAAVLQGGDRFLADLRRSRQSGDLRDSQLARVLLTCCEPLAPMELSADYDFESLVEAIRDADLSVAEVDKLAGKLEGRELAISIVRRVVVGLSQALAGSRRLQALAIRLAEEILGLPEIRMTVQWPPGGEDRFYNAALLGDEREIERVLEEYCPE